MVKKILIYCLTLLLTAPTWSQPMQVGAAKRVLTPNPLLPVSGGVGTPRPTEKKQGDLFVRAMVVSQNNTVVAIASIDNLGWPAALGDQSRLLVEGIPPENILISATHTHSAPDAYGFPDEQGKILADHNYLKWCIQQVADAINEAKRNLQPASLKIAVGEAQGKIAYNYYAPQLYDPRCGVIQAIATSGKEKGNIITTLVNYAIHPEVIGAGRGILSPDLCGPLYDRIEAQTGGMALFVNGAQGGMVTADNRLPQGGEANDWNECKRIGFLLADEALRIIQDAEQQKEATLYCKSSTLKLPVSSPLMQMLLDKTSLQQTKDYTLETKVNLINIGSAQILTIPGEALPNIGYYLKRNMKTNHPFLFGLTNDAYGYILTKEDFNSFKRYEYISKTSLGEMTGDLFIEHALNLIRENPGAVNH